MALTLLRYGVYWCDLSPTFGHQLQKVRPYVILSPDSVNQRVGTVIISPLSTQPKGLPFQLDIISQGKGVVIACDQIKVIDKRKIKGFITTLSEKDITRLQELLHELLVA